MNKEYLLATQKLYQDPSQHKLSYSVARKKHFLLSVTKRCLSAIDQDPKSKQTEFQLIYEIVTLNQTILPSHLLVILSAVIKLHLLLSNLIYSSKKLPIHYRCHSMDDTQIEKNSLKPLKMQKKVFGKYQH
jgi:hypothetical protein